ncbi:MAG: Transcriptional repressor, BlaI/MecI family [Verrucomicrobiales bacterium]|nr:Transcriptional repressor, BlaI/MecI family [Verrucomicrobiales bacterium]
MQKQTYRLGDLQLKIMKVLWEKSEASVPEIHETLQTDKELAYTTIATMLRKMEARGLVKHRVEERKFIYTAAVREDAVSKKMTEHLLDHLFEGSLADMVSHLLSSREISPEELSKLQRLITERKKKK